MKWGSDAAADRDGIADVALVGRAAVEEDDRQLSTSSMNLFGKALKSTSRLTGIIIRAQYPG